MNEKIVSKCGVSVCVGLECVDEGDRELWEGGMGWGILG